MTHTTESLMELADAYGKLLAYHATDDYMVCDDGKKRFALQSAITELVAERDALAKDRDQWKYEAMHGGHADQLRTECDTLRAQLDALQSEDELPRLDRHEHPEPRRLK